MPPDLRKMKKVSIDKENLKIIAGGGCKAVDLEIPLQAEGYYAVFGAANETGRYPREFNQIVI
jgi:hypothetical protein